MFFDLKKNKDIISINQYVSIIKKSINYIDSLFINNFFGFETKCLLDSEDPIESLIIETISLINDSNIETKHKEVCFGELKYTLNLILEYIEYSGTKDKNIIFNFFFDKINGTYASIYNRISKYENNNKTYRHISIK